MTPHEQKRILSWNQQLSNPIKIQLMINQDERSVMFHKFCKEFELFATKVRIIVEMDESVAFPKIRIGKSLYYQCIPLGTELAPFLNALSRIADPSIQTETDILKTIRKIPLPLSIKIYVSPQCHFCPEVIRKLIPLNIENPMIEISIIDGVMFSELAEKDHIRSVPTVFLEDQLRWTGSIPMHELVDAMLDRDRLMTLSPSTIERMILNGDAYQVAKVMLDKGEVFPVFLDFLMHERLPLRLGAMVIIEEIASGNMNLAKQTIEPIRKRLKDLDDQIKGDVIYVIGEIGGAEMLPVLDKQMHETENPEIHEAIREAIGKIKQKRL